VTTTIQSAIIQDSASLLFKIKGQYIFANKLLKVVLLLLIGFNGFAQSIQVDDTYSAQQLVEALVQNSCAQISNVSINGGSGGGNSFGYFTAGDNFPFANGIVLTTGLALSAQGPNTSLIGDGWEGWGGDSDLEDALSITSSFNATVLEFDFVPSADHISFDYIFASEEYTTWSSEDMCNYSDGFAFLLKVVGDNSPGSNQNLAVIPGTDVPVKVTTVRGAGFCPSANEEYFEAFNGTDHPTNFNGQTVVLTAQADVLPGTVYHIKLVIADQGDTIYDSAIFLGGGSFNATANLGPDRLVATGNPLCEGDTLALDATNPSATAYEWYRNGQLLPAEDNATYTIVSAGEYSVRIQLGATCFAETSITAEYTLLPASSAQTLLQCDEDNDGLAEFDLNLAAASLTGGNTGLSISYYLDANNAENQIDPINDAGHFQNTIPNQHVFARVSNQYGCFAISTLTLATAANGVTSPAPLKLCDEDGIEDGFTAFDLTQTEVGILQGLPPGLVLKYYNSSADAFLAINPITNPSAFINTIADGQLVYARVNNGSDCFGIAEIELIVHSFGSAFDNEEVVLCEMTVQPLIAPGGYVTYTWDTTPPQSTSSISVITPGTYTVTVTNADGCEGSKTFTVVPSGPATAAVIEVNDFAGSANTVSITAVGIGDYEFSLDGISYQDASVFANIASGEYILYIRDKNGCGPVYEDVFFVLDYPKFFTPNGDGTNDIWRIPYLNNYPDTVVTVFDRYGKIITAFKGSDHGWDGNYNGKPLPSTDYWFTILLENSRLIKGHFAIMR